jgi:SprT protein
MRQSAWQMAFPWLTQPLQKASTPLHKGNRDETRTAWCREIAASFGLTELAQKVEVVWNPRMRSTAGRAWWPQRLIELNPKIDSLDAQQTERTLRHELAHLIAYERAGRRKIAPHGREWRQACSDLGIANESVCHQLPLPRRTQTIRYHYICPHCRAEIKRVRKIKRALACLTCCNMNSGGRYDARFRFVEKKP